MEPQKFMIHKDPGTGRWVNPIKDAITPKSPFQDLEIKRPTSGDRPITLDAYLASVVMGSDYQPGEVVAVGFGTTDFLQREKLHYAYLTPRGLEEATMSGKLSEPYTNLRERLVGHPRELQELDGPNLGLAAQMSGTAETKTFIDWSALDGKKRVVVIHSYDETRHKF